MCSLFYTIAKFGDGDASALVAFDFPYHRARMLELAARIQTGMCMIEKNAYKICLTHLVSVMYMTYRVFSYPPCLVLSCLVLLVSSSRVLSSLILSYLVVSCLVLSCRVLSCLVLSCLVLSSLVLSCLAFD